MTSQNVVQKGYGKSDPSKPTDGISIEESAILVSPGAASDDGEGNMTTS
jgi:hypothetical protein